MSARLLLTSSLLIFSIILTNCSLKLVEDAALENAISYSLEIVGDSVLIGTHTYINFTILNGYDQDIFVDDNPYGFFINGSHVGGFQVYARKENGEIINSIYGQGGMVASGRFGIRKISPSQSHTILIPLFYHIDIQTPGKYELFVTKDMSVFFDKRKKKIGHYPSSKSYKKRIRVTKTLNLSFEALVSKT